LKAVGRRGGLLEGCGDYLDFLVGELLIAHGNIVRRSAGGPARLDPALPGLLRR
jgi:hypothetical protein